MGPEEIEEITNQLNDANAEERLSTAWQTELLLVIARLLLDIVVRQGELR